jgi:hypothetical protein
MNALFASTPGMLEPGNWRAGDPIRCCVFSYNIIYLKKERGLHRNQ